MTVAYVGLGANLDDPPGCVRQALEGLGKQAGIELVAASSLYRSAPLGPPGQADYCNAVAELSTDLSASALLERLLNLEQAMGRERDGERWGPRLIDLDLLLYGDATINEPGLTVPHPEMQRRNFVLQPLVEIAPGLRIPGQGPVHELLQSIDDGLQLWEARA